MVQVQASDGEDLPTLAGAATNRRIEAHAQILRRAGPISLLMTR
jgi:hypothetical protein